MGKRKNKKKSAQSTQKENFSGVSSNKYNYFKDIANKFQRVQEECINQAKDKFGNDVFENFYINDNFNIEEFAKKRLNGYAQEKTPSIAVPFSDSTFELFKRMPKKIIGKAFRNNSLGKCTDVYILIGKNEGKNVLFTLAIRKHSPDDFSHMNIKLDLWVKGKEWIPIARIDTSGYAHPNYFDINGEIAKSFTNIQKINTPHMHLNSNKISIMHSTKLDYLPAEFVNVDISKYYSSDNRILEKYMNYLADKFNIKDEKNILIKNSSETEEYIF